MDERYAVKVCYKTALKEVADMIGNGIEEEGVPFLLVPLHSEKNSEIRCEDFVSGLQVIVIVAEEGIDLYFKQLKENKPYICYKLYNRELLKTIGKNAARLAKRKPLIIESNKRVRSFMSE